MDSKSDRVSIESRCGRHRSLARGIEIKSRQRRAQLICISVPPTARVAVPENAAPSGDGALEEFLLRSDPLDDGVRRGGSFTPLEAGDSPLIANCGCHGKVIRAIHEM